MNCLKCGTPNPPTSNLARGTRYCIMKKCQKCSRSVQIEGVAKVSPPITVKPAEIEREWLRIANGWTPEQREKARLELEAEMEEGWEPLKELLSA